MEDIKSIIAGNIVQLRRKSGMTQIELAEKLNYSDKAVSKWERGESVPDISVLKNIADLFGVTVDYLITAEHEEICETEQESLEDAEEVARKKKRKKVMIAGMSVLLVWLVAAVIFVPLDIVMSDTMAHWIAFPIIQALKPVFSRLSKMSVCLSLPRNLFTSKTSFVGVNSKRLWIKPKRRLPSCASVLATSIP